MTQLLRNKLAGMADHNPPRPDVVHEVVELVDNPSTSVARLAATVGKDQALTSMVLRKANSSYYGFSGRVTNVNFALVLLGFNVLRETVTHALVSSAFRNLVGVMFSYEELWNHSLACGVLARRLATMTQRCDSDEAFSAGLLHDVGYVVLDQGGPSQLAAHIKAKLKTGIGNTGKTISALTLSHEEAGALIAKQWNIPASVGEAIRYHHHPQRAKINPALTAIVHTADVLSKRLPWGVVEDVAGTTVNAHAIRLLELDDSLFSEKSMEEFTKLLKSELPQAPTFEELVSFFRQSIVNTIEKMNPDQKVVIALHYSEGLSFKEIAEVLRRAERQVIETHTEAFALLRHAIEACV